MVLIGDILFKNIFLSSVPSLFLLLAEIQNLTFDPKKRVKIKGKIPFPIGDRECEQNRGEFAYETLVNARTLEIFRHQ